MYLIIEAKKVKLSTVPECCMTEYSLTPPDSPTTNDGGPKLNKKKKVLFIVGKQITMINHRKDETFDANKWNDSSSKD